MTQSITEPPVWQAPRQCHRFFFGLTTSEGSWSSWKGQQAEQVRAVPLQLDAAGLDQPLDADLLFEPLDLGIRDARHQKFSLSDVRI